MYYAYTNYGVVLCSPISILIIICNGNENCNTWSKNGAVHWTRSRYKNAENRQSGGRQNASTSFSIESEHNSIECEVDNT